jgi:hypothetical protein
MALPDSVKSIAPGTFRGCSELYDLHLPQAWVETHGVEDILRVISGDRKDRGRNINRIVQRYLEGGILGECLVPIALERLSHKKYRNNWFDKLSRDGNAQALSRLLDLDPDVPERLFRTALNRTIHGGSAAVTALLLAHQNRHTRPGDNPAFPL